MHCKYQASGRAPLSRSLSPQLSEKDLSMLEERIKRSAKEAPPPPKPAEDSRAPKTLPSNASMLRKPADTDASAKLRYATPL